MAGLLVVAAAGCAGQGAHYNPFVVPKTEITSSVRTIALAPLTATQDLAGVDPRRGQFDSLLGAELRAAGYAVVPPEEAIAIWTRVQDSLGGLFDPVTGRRDSVKFGELHSFVALAPAKFDAGTATWDGTSQSYQSTGKKLLAALFGAETYGRMQAISVQVLLEDMSGRELYANRGGLQLYAVPSGKEFVQVPSREFYADRVRNARAVHLALAPLVGSGDVTGGEGH